MTLPVVILEDSVDLRTVMAELLKRRLGVPCLCLGSLEELVAHAEVTLQAKIIFLDINLGEGRPSGLDAFRWLAEARFSGVVYFLTGHAQRHPLVVEAATSGVRILEKPLRPVELTGLVSQALGAGA